MTTKNKTYYWDAEDSKKTLDQIEASLLATTQIAPNHTFHDEVNYLNTVTVGLRHLIKSLNFGCCAKTFRYIEPWKITIANKNLQTIFSNS